jgi:hypothetical protein
MFRFFKRTFLSLPLANLLKHKFTDSLLATLQAPKLVPLFMVHKPAASNPWFGTNKIKVTSCKFVGV